MSENQQLDRTTLAALFASRVKLAKMTEDEAAESARREHQKTLLWIASKSEKVGSFVWFCDFFDMDFSAVRRAIQEKKR